MISPEQLAEWNSVTNEAPKDSFYCASAKDSAFISAAREAMPTLLAEVHSLQCELAYLQEKRESIENLYRHVLGECHKCVNERGLLEEQADVLARKLAEFGQCTANDPHDCFHAKDCINCWREYAQKAVENG